MKLIKSLKLSLQTTLFAHKDDRFYQVRGRAMKMGWVKDSVPWPFTIPSAALAVLPKMSFIRWSNLILVLLVLALCRRTSALSEGEALQRLQRCYDGQEVALPEDLIRLYSVLRLGQQERFHPRGASFRAWGWGRRSWRWPNKVARVSVLNSACVPLWSAGPRLIVC